MTLLLEGMRDFLVGEGLVRKPAVAAPDDEPNLPPMWLEPRSGVPAPGEGRNPVEVGPDLVLGAYVAPGIPPAAYENFLRNDGVEIRFRSKSAPRAIQFEIDLRKTLNDIRNFMMGGVSIVEVRMWQDMRRIGSDEQAFTYSVGYVFQRLDDPDLI